MARHGLGPALVPDFLAAKLIASGDLERVYPEPAPSGRRYFFSYKAARKGEPGLQALGAWFKQQVSGQAGQR